MTSSYPGRIFVLSHASDLGPAGSTQLAKGHGNMRRVKFQPHHRGLSLQITQQKKLSRIKMFAKLSMETKPFFSMNLLVYKRLAGS